MKIFLAIAAGLATAIILFALYRRWTYTPMSTAMIGRTLVITAARDGLVFGPRRHDFLVALGEFRDEGWRRPVIDLTHTERPLNPGGFLPLVHMTVNHEEDWKPILVRPTGWKPEEFAIYRKLLETCSEVETLEEALELVSQPIRPVLE